MSRGKAYQPEQVVNLLQVANKCRKKRLRQHEIVRFSTRHDAMGG